MSSWNETVHFCDWHGITCGRRRQRVTLLDLTSSKLTGELSPFIGNLSFLKQLHLQNNTLSGTIPPEIGALHRLRSLSLTNNSIGGEIPSNISSCSSLVELLIFNNKLVGGIPPELGLLSRLQTISLSLNNLTGTIPSSLGNLTYLSSLSLGASNLVGRIPDSFGNLKRLTFLALPENSLSGIVPASIFNLSLLTIIDIGENAGLEGNLPSELGNQLPQLYFLSIANNQFTGNIPASVSNLSNLEVLEFSNNYLHGQVPPLQKLVKLRHLNVGANYLGTGHDSDLSFVSSLAKATKLQQLLILENKFEGVFPRTICSFYMLLDLLLDYNNIVGRIPECIENLVNLQYFGASSNKLSGAIPHNFGKLQNLNVVRLGNNQLSGFIPSSIGNLTNLNTLDLTHNKLEGQIPPALGRCLALVKLDLSQNNLNGRIPSELYSLSSLSVGLNLSNNRLSGLLPEDLGKLSNLASLDVSGNMLSGTIPSSLSFCIALEMLYMSGNFFQGPIPDALKTLRGLRWLDLSRNNLSGDIPEFLANLPLQMINLSYNINLAGKLPSAGVFSNVSGVSVAGNTGLCGGVPKLKLPKCRVDKNNIRKPDHRRRIVLSIVFGLLGLILVVATVILLTFWYKKPIVSAESGISQNVSYQRLFAATNGFASDNLIGSGTFGIVYKGDLNGATVAIKIFKLEHRGASKSFMAECEALRNIRHRNLVKVITACSGVDYQGNDFKALIYDYMANGSLDDWLHPTKPVSRTEDVDYVHRSLKLHQRLDIAVDIALAVEYLHHNCGALVVHCDLKPSNVLLDQEMVAHVSDFGLAKLLSQSWSSSSHVDQSSSIGVRGTIGYTPPEYGLGNEPSTGGDVYSFGILLLEMFTGKRPSDDMFKEGMTLHNVVRETLSDRIMEILDQALVEDIYEEETNSSHAMEGVVSILEIGLSCSAESPQERLDMADVVVKLSSIRKKLQKTQLQQQRRIIR